jgi:transposase
MHEDIIPMKRKDIERLRIIQKAIDKHMTQVEAGKQLSLHERQIRRMVKAVREEGVTGIIHGNRGRESPRKIAEKIKQKIMSLIKRKYSDFGPTLAGL